MTFPAVPLGFIFELFLNNAWTDVSAAQNVLHKSAVTLTRGSSDEASKPDASSCRFDLDDTSGNYSPRNPEGIYYGSLGLNTPFRLTLRQDRDDANRTVSNGWGSTTQLAAPWSIDLVHGNGTLVASDFSVVPGALRHSVPVAGGFRISYLPTTPYREIDVSVDFTLTLASVTGAGVSPSVILRGTTTTTYYTVSAVVTTAGALQLTIEDTAGNTIAGPLTVAGLTYTSSTAYRLRAQIEGQTLRAKIWAALGAEPYAWQLAVHNADTFIPGWVGVRSDVFTGNTNTKPVIFAYSNLVIRQPRMAGEVADLRVRWSKSGADCRSEILAKGIRRRLGQGASPLASTLRRGNSTAVPAPVAYWPCEDAKNSTSIASGLPGGNPMIVSGDLTYAAYSGLPASEPLPTLKAAYLDGIIPPYTPPSPNAVQMRFILVTPSSPEIPDESYVADLHNTGSAGLWRIKYNTTGDLRIEVWSSAFAGGPDILNATGIDFNLIGKRMLVSLELTQNGANIDWKLVTLEVGQSTGFFGSGTVNAKTIGVATRVFIDPLKVCSGLSIGHIAVHPKVTTVFDLSSELNAFTGELALSRMLRLCGQEAIPFSYIGNPLDTPAMGAQLPRKLLDLLDECADVDQGLLYDPRGDVGFEYRTRASAYNQATVLDLDYSAEHVIEPFEPADDDRFILNDLRATRVDGSEFRATLDVGRKSTLPPKDGGAGRYDAQRPFNFAEDGQLVDLAYWLIWLGTYNDDARYPQIAVALALPGMIAAGKNVTAAELNLLDRMTVSNPYRKHNPNQIAQLVRGYTESFRNYEHSLVINGAPASPYEVLEVGTTGKMAIGNDSTTLTGGPGGAYSTSATSLQFSSTGDLWSTTAGDYPVDIDLAGEVVRVTAMSGASSPQTATVVRSINGVVKGQVNGTAVKLARRATVGY